MVPSSQCSPGKDFCAAVRVGLAHLAIGELPHPDAVWVENVLLSVCKFYRFDTALFNLLNSAIWENTLLVTVFKYALDSAIREAKVKNG